MASCLVALGCWQKGNSGESVKKDLLSFYCTGEVVKWFTFPVSSIAQFLPDSAQKKHLTAKLWCLNRFFLLQTSFFTMTRLCWIMSLPVILIRFWLSGRQVFFISSNFSYYYLSLSVMMGQKKKLASVSRMTLILTAQNFPCFQAAASPTEIYHSSSSSWNGPITAFFPLFLLVWKA